MDNELIGKRIKQYRRTAKMTQEQLAAEIGKSLSSVKKYEMGLIEIPHSVLERIGKTLHFDPLDLYSEHLVSEKFKMLPDGYKIEISDPDWMIITYPDGTEIENSSKNITRVFEEYYGFIDQATEFANKYLIAKLEEFKFDTKDMFKNPE